jgi:hypothetical protein
MLRAAHDAFLIGLSDDDSILAALVCLNLAAIISSSIMNRCQMHTCKTSDALRVNYDIPHLNKTLSRTSRKIYDAINFSFFYMNVSGKP